MKIQYHTKLVPWKVKCKINLQVIQVKKMKVQITNIRNEKVGFIDTGEIKKMSYNF